MVAQPDKSVVVCTCDFCEKKSNRTCHACDRDICVDHIKYDPRDEHSDHPTKFCPECFEIGAWYIEEMRSVQSAACGRVEELESQWYAKARANVRKEPPDAV